MKKLILCACVAASAIAFAETEKETVKEETEAASPSPSFWGFLNYGWYSGYQLYGSIVNTQPTLQSYGELNLNLPWAVGAMDDLGYFGFGLWHNSDLTRKRNDSYRRAFNEFDFNFHWQKPFYFDEAKTWAITYRTFVVWYYYPKSGGRDFTPVTFDWDHSVELTNPYLIPYCTWVHEYAQSNGNLLQFGVKKPFANLFDVEGLSMTPFVEFVWRDDHYLWCFSNYGCHADGEPVSAGISTMKIQLDFNYQFCSWCSIFAKVAYCANIQDEMRDACDEITYDAAYGRENEFVWGGAGLCVNF